MALIPDQEPAVWAVALCLPGDEGDNPDIGHGGNPTYSIIQIQNQDDANRALNQAR